MALSKRLCCAALPLPVELLSFALGFLSQGHRADLRRVSTQYVVGFTLLRDGDVTLGVQISRSLSSAPMSPVSQVRNL